MEAISPFVPRRVCFVLSRGSHCVSSHSVLQEDSRNDCRHFLLYSIEARGDTGDQRRQTNSDASAKLYQCSRLIIF